MRALMGMEEELQILFKRINKKSAKSRQTRLKALNRLAEILGEKDGKFLDQFAGVFAIVFEKLLLSETDSEVLELNQKCLKAILTTHKKSIMKSFGLFLPQMLLGLQEPHSAASKIAHQNLNILVRTPEKRGRGVLHFGAKFVILLAPLLSNSQDFLKQLGADDDQKILDPLSEKLCKMGLLCIADIFDCLAALPNENDKKEGFDAFKMLLFEELVYNENVEKKEEPENEGESEGKKIKKKKKKKKKRKKKQKLGDEAKRAGVRVKCFEVLRRFPKSKLVRGALMKVLERLFLLKFDGFLCPKVRETIIRKMFSKFLTEPNVDIQQHWYENNLINHMLEIARQSSISVNEETIFKAVEQAIRDFGSAIGEPFYANIVPAIKGLEFTQKLGEGFLNKTSRLLQAFEPALVDSRLRHQVEAHFKCLFDLANWIIFERLNLANEGELVFVAQVVSILGGRWFSLYLESHNPDQKSRLVLGVNEIKYFPSQLRQYLQNAKKRFSAGEVNRYRIIEKMFLEEIYDIIKEHIGKIGLVGRNLRFFITEFAQNIMLGRKELLDEVVPFKRRMTLMQVINQLGPNFVSDNKNSSFLTRLSERGSFQQNSSNFVMENQDSVSKPEFSSVSPDPKSEGKVEIYSKPEIESYYKLAEEIYQIGPCKPENENSALNQDDHIEEIMLSEWSKDGSDVVSLGRSNSNIIKRVSNFSQNLLEGYAVAGESRVYKKPESELLEISFDMLSLTIHCINTSLEKALKLLWFQETFAEGLDSLREVISMCEQVVNPLGLIYFRSTAMRAKMSTVVDHFVSQVERIFNLEVLRHGGEKRFKDKTKLVNYYMGLLELFKSLSGFVSLSKVGKTLNKLFESLTRQVRTAITNKASLAVKSPSLEVAELGSERDFTKKKAGSKVVSFQHMRSFTSSALPGSQIEMKQDRVVYSMKVEAGQISSISLVEIAGERLGKFKQQDVIMEEENEGSTVKKNPTQERQLEGVISGFGEEPEEQTKEVHFDLQSPSKDLDRENDDKVGNLIVKNYKNAFKNFHAKMFDSMIRCDLDQNALNEDQESRENQEVADNVFSNSHISDEDEQQKWKPDALNAEAFLRLLLQGLFGLREFNRNPKLLNWLVGCEETLSFSQKMRRKQSEVQEELEEQVELALNQLKSKVKGRSFARSKDCILGYIRTTRDYITLGESLCEFEDLFSPNRIGPQDRAKFQRGKSLFFPQKKTMNERNTKNQFQNFDPDLFASVLMVRRSVRQGQSNPLGEMFNRVVGSDDIRLMVPLQWVLQFDENDLFLHRKLLDSIQIHLGEARTRNHSEGLLLNHYRRKETTSADIEHSLANQKINYYQIPKLRLKSGGTSHLAGAVEEANSKLQHLFPQILAEKELSSPLIFERKEADVSGPKPSPFFFERLLHTKVQMIRKALEKFEKNYLNSKKRQLFSAAERTVLDKGAMWKSFWRQVADATFSFGVAHSQSLKKLGNTKLKMQDQRRKKKPENLSRLEMDNLLQLLISDLDIGLPRKQELLNDMVSYLLENKMISRETMCLLLKTSKALLKKDENTNGAFVLSLILNLLLSDHKSPEFETLRGEIIAGILAAFPRFEPRALFRILVRSPEQIEKLSKSEDQGDKNEKNKKFGMPGKLNLSGKSFLRMNEMFSSICQKLKSAGTQKRLSVLVSIISQQSDLMGFVEGHKNKALLWKTLVNSHLRSEFESLFYDDFAAFTHLFTHLLWSGQERLTTRNFLFSTLMSLVRRHSGDLKIDKMPLQKTIMGIFRFLLISINHTWSNDLSQLPNLLDFYRKMLSEIPKKLQNFDLANFVDKEIQELNSPSQMFENENREKVEQSVRKGLKFSLGFFGIPEIVALLYGQSCPEFVAFNSVLVPIYRGDILEKYKEEVAGPEDLNESVEIETESAQEKISKIVCDLAEIHEIKDTFWQKAGIEARTAPLFDLEAGLETLETWKAAARNRGSDTLTLIRSVLIGSYTWMLSANKVDIFSERVEQVETQIKAVLALCKARETVFWRSACSALLKFLRKVILYLEMFSEDVQQNLMVDTISLAIDFTRQFDAKALHHKMKLRFWSFKNRSCNLESPNQRSQRNVTSSYAKIMESQEPKSVQGQDTEKTKIPYWINQEDLESMTTGEFCVEVAETLSRFALRSGELLRPRDLIALLNSSIPQFKKAAFLLLIRSENSLMRKKFDLNVKLKIANDDADEQEHSEWAQEKVVWLLSHIKSEYLPLFGCDQKFIQQIKDSQAKMEINENSDRDVVAESKPNMENTIYKEELPRQIFLELRDLPLQALIFPAEIESSNSTLTPVEVLESAKALRLSKREFEKDLSTRLMFWSIMLRLASNEWRTVAGDQVQYLLSNLFSLSKRFSDDLLERVFLYSRYEQQKLVSIIKQPASDGEVFLKPEQLLEESSSLSNSDLCGALSLNVLFSFACGFQKTFRSFLSNSRRKKMLNFTEKLLAEGLSDRIFQREIKALLEHSEVWKTEDFLVSYHQGSREISAVYVQDETEMEVKIYLPPKYPLKMASVTLDRVVQKKFRWQMMMKKLLTHHNVGLVGALQMWKNNVDKHFEGVDPCPICYYVIQYSTKKLPEKMCRTCKKKFHDVCIVKWFQTSAKTECPMCKSQFV